MDVFTLSAKIIADISQYESGLNKAAEMGKNVMGGIGKLAKVGMGVATAAIGAGTAAMGAFGKQSLSAYASYEQLAGGVQKLYGENTTATKTFMDNAKNAYKTAQMSTNQYMETATSMSGSLLKSLGGDADKAAEMVDVAMKAMADNVNTFGTDSERVSAAILGLARNNFTMIDNLNLGFSGSKAGMEELIAKANELREANGEMGNLSIESYADMITAIQTVQENMNIAGATAKEAMTTIEGSANMTKAAWENLITAIGRGEGLQEAIGGLKEAIFGIGLTDDGKATGLLNQVIPRIQTIMEGAGEFIKESAPLISEKIPELIDAVLPSMMEGGLSLAGALAQGIFDSLPSVWSAVSDVAITVGDYLSRGMEEAARATESLDLATPLGHALDKVDELLNGEKTQNFIDNGVAFVTHIAEGVGTAAPDLIPKAAEVVAQFIQGIEDNIPQILDAGANMAIGLAVGLVKALPTLWLELQNLKLTVLSYIAEHVAAFSTKAYEGASSLIAKVVSILPQLPEKIAYYTGYAMEMFGLKIMELPSKFAEAASKLKEKLDAWRDTFPKSAEEAGSMFALKLFESFEALKEKVKQWAENIANAFIGGIKAVLDFNANIFSSFWNGAQQANEDNKVAKVERNSKQVLNSAAPKALFEEGNEGINYETLAEYIVKAFVDAEIKIECDDREFGRLVRKVVEA